jgi:hypothetical protein
MRASMNLQPVGGQECYVQCCVCLKMVSTKEALADMNGEPFKAYYHPKCAESVREVQP